MPRPSGMLMLVERTLIFENRWYPGRTLREAVNVARAIAQREVTDADAPQGFYESISGEVGPANDRWSYDDLQELCDGIDSHRELTVSVRCQIRYLHITYYWFAHRAAHIQVRADSRDSIAEILAPFLDPANYEELPVAPEPPAPAPHIFIGHGGSPAWRDLKDHLELHKYNVEAFESGARAGHAVRDVLQGLVSRSTFAFLVFTAEDQQADESWRARQNVVHEAGLFQGALGFSRAVVLLEEGVELFSNFDGIQWIGFPKGHIRAAFGDALAVLTREFPGA